MESDYHVIQAWYEANKRSLFAGGLWFLGGEPNTQSPEEFDQSNLRVLITRLSSYHDTASGISHSYLFQMAREVPGTFVDLGFLPPPRDESLLQKSGIPFWTGTTSKRPPRDFDLIAISNSVVQELLNLPAMLAGSGIPLSRQEREFAGAPFILLGGSNSYVTSLLHGPIGNECPGDGLVDGVLMGDGEVAFPRLLKLLRENKGLPRRDLLSLFCEEVPGFYDPAKFRQEYDERGGLRKVSAAEGEFKPVRVHRISQEDAEKTFTFGPILYDEDAAGTSHLLVSYGCPYFCSFCKESWEQKPYREAGLKNLVAGALELKKHLGLSELDLMSFNINTFSPLSRVLCDLETLFDRVTVKSQRFDAIVLTPRLLEKQLQVGKKTYTCAMEGISDRVRAFLQKNLTEETLASGFKILFKNNIRQMKVFLIVTGIEVEKDFLEFDSFLSRLNQILSEFKGKPIITFSLAALFRPPLTPLQFEPPRGGPGDLKKSFDRISESVVKAGFEIRTSAGMEDAMVSEFMAYADRRSTEILVEAGIKRGFRYRGQINPEVYHFWKKALSDKKIQLVQDQEKTIRTVFPWDDVDSGIPKEFLWKNYQTLKSGSQVTSCIAAPLGSGSCLACGACPDPASKKRLLRHAPILPGNPPGPVVPVKPVRYRLEGVIPAKWAGVGNRFLFAAIARLMMMGKPSWTRSFLRFEDGIQRPGAGGLFVADFFLAPGAERLGPGDIEAMNLYGNGMAVRTIRSAEKPLKDDYPALLCRFRYPPNIPVSTISRRVDDLMTRLKLKHQKQWQETTLCWIINPGHAKKVGFSKIRWVKDSSDLYVTIDHPLELHLFDKFGSDTEREFFPPDSRLVK